MTIIEVLNKVSIEDMIEMENIIKIIEEINIKKRLVLSKSRDKFNKNKIVHHLNNQILKKKFRTMRSDCIVMNAIIDLCKK